MSLFFDNNHRYGLSEWQLGCCWLPKIKMLCITWWFPFCAKRANTSLILIKNQTPHDPFTDAECGLELLFMKPQENAVLHYPRWWFTKAINCSSKGEGTGREAGMTGLSPLPWSGFILYIAEVPGEGRLLLLISFCTPSCIYSTKAM